MLGPYELRGELGRGAMAIVWRGFDTRLEREVAIKEPVVPAGTDDAARQDLALRFVREGKAAAGLNHPGIVTIHAADVFGDRPAIVMEIIEGETLSGVLERGPLPAAAALSVIDQLLDAVGYAHAHGVVHRDIKPDNVFLTSDGRIKLADFGIAHVGSTAALTQAGTVMGTPGYMAPEQVTGAPVDARADIFAIGVIAFELLTGHNPFGATDGIAPTTVMYRIVHEPMPQLPASVFASLPIDIAQVLIVATAKDPASRFADANSFRTALAGGPIVTGVPGTPSTVVSVPWSPAANLASPAASTGQNWTPYLIVGAVMLVVVGLLFVFSSGGGARGGAVAATTVPPKSNGTAQAKSPSPHELNATSASASSELSPSGPSTYSAMNVIDRNASTAWAEASDSYGEGEWLQVDFSESVFVTQIRVIPGYMKNVGGWDRWWTNGRVCEARFEFTDGSSHAFTFQDTQGWQSVALPKPVQTTSVRLVIVSVYAARSSGSHSGAPDTNISEMAVDGWTAAEAK